MRFSLSALVAALLVASFSVVSPVFASDSEDAALHFANRVWPILSERCLACHGQDEEKIKGGLDLRTAVAALTGGDSGEPAWIAGKPEDSALYLSTLRTDDFWEAMPPKESDALSVDEREILRAWIADGALWLNAEERAAFTDRPLEEGLTRVETSQALDETWQNRIYEEKHLWAFLPVTKTKPPGSRRAGETGAHPIDAFLGAAMEESGIAPAPRGEPWALLRRLHFDLTGLPPTPEETDNFLEAYGRDPDATWKAEIERLLDSPHYGERQAQHWLDVTRYADTDGGSNDYERAGVWRYRDYVVRSFNEDLPYDRFVIEQIAGDLLPTGDAESLLATGFLRMGPWEATKMNPKAVIRQQFLDDVVNHVGETFLAQALRCAKCHDHKFDPVPTRDYYQVMAAFGDTHPAEVETPFLSAERHPDGAAEQIRVAREVKRINEEIDALERIHLAAAIAWLEDQGTDTSTLKPRGNGDFSVFASLFNALPEANRPPKNIGLDPDQITRAAVLTKYRKYLQRGLERYEPVAFAVYSGPGNDYSSHRSRNPIPDPGEGEANGEIRILSGGDLGAPTEAVEPGALSAVESLAGHPFDEEGDGTPSRLALAHWIADPANPLTARVIVNRIWQQHFSGRGLVATPSNFGYTGEKPSHPVLLDYLASWFVEKGWSIKELHRLILTSEAYRRSARHPEPDRLAERDPDGTSFAAFPARRLHAEEMRDAMLVASGEWNPAVGGPPVFPEINLEAALQPRHVQSGLAPAYQPSPQPEDRHRRTLYAYRMRGLPDPAQEVFNRPSADLSCERRDATTVTPQVFSLFNGQQAHDRSLALALRLQANAETKPDRVRESYRLVFGRAANEVEIARALAFLEKQEAHHRATEPEPVAPPTSVRRAMVFEMTGVLSEWEEPLDIYATSFVADRKPWEVDPQTRALASLCLVLFNANEFLYLE